jgi:hypothetical protein
MSLGCKCDLGLSNTGKPNCVTLQSVTSKLVLVPLKDSTGAKNYLDLATTINEATFTALINQADSSKRWFPLGLFENVEMAKADSTFEEAPSGRKVFIKQGKRSFAGELWNETPQLLGKIQDNRCVDFGVYVVDVNGNLIGSKVGTKLYPIPVDNESFEAKLMFATDSTAQKVMVAFDFYRLFDESSLWLVTADEASLDFNNLEGLLDVNFAMSSLFATGADASLTLDYGTALNPIKVKGLVASDFVLFNVTDNASVTITSVVETLEGRYTLAFASQTSADVLKLSLDKEGYVGFSTFVIP